MKFTLCLLVVIMLIATSDSWLLRRRRRRRTTVVNNTTVQCVCVVNCGPGAVCKYNCNYRCKGGRKRQEQERSTPPEGFNLILPCKLEAWDSNKDGFIQLDEFLFTAHSNTEDTTGVRLFGFIDTDDDGSISKEEFKLAPLQKEKC